MNEPCIEVCQYVDLQLKYALYLIMFAPKRNCAIYFLVLTCKQCYKWHNLVIYDPMNCNGPEVKDKAIEKYNTTTKIIRYLKNHNNNNMKQQQ